MLLLSVGLATSSLRTEKLRPLLNVFNGFIWAAFILSLGITYFIVFSGQHNGVGILPFSIIFSHIKNLDAITELTGISRQALYISALLPLMTLVLLTAYLSSIIPDGIKDLKLYSKDFIREYKNNSRRSHIIDRCVLLVLIGALIFMLYRESLTARLVRAREPLFTMIYGETHYMGGFHFSRNQEPASVRANYPKNISFHKKNVILIIVDALRAQNMSLYGYTRPTTPYLLQMYHDHKIQKIDYAFSSSAASLQGILSILRSKPCYDLSYHNFSISELLRDQGYRINYILSGDHTNWYDLKYFYGKDIDHYFDGRQSAHYVCDDELLMEGLDKVKPYKDSASFFYFHMMSVHGIGLRHPQFVRWTPVTIDKDSTYYRNNYDNGILQADSYIKKLFQELEKKGYLQNSIVIITADHGESVGERHTWGHIGNVYNEQIRIPLLIYDSDSGIRYDKRRFAEHPDIAATIADRLGLPQPASWQGRSMLKDSFDRFAYHSVSDDYAIIDRSDDRLRKFYYHVLTNKEELYDLDADPYEQKNIIAQAAPDYLITLRQKMKLFLSEHKNYY
jgi:glucan phosphoethanolaminetransferase (alkaline phosphatase superfamily)